MASRTFFDTNVLVYLFDADSRVKQSKARDALQGALERGPVVISTQVLQEFFVTVTRKLAQVSALAGGEDRAVRDDPDRTGPHHGPTVSTAADSQESLPGGNRDFSDHPFMCSLGGAKEVRNLASEPFGRKICAPTASRRLTSQSRRALAP
jgi:hypothetical protein